MSRAEQTSSKKPSPRDAYHGEWLETIRGVRGEQGCGVRGMSALQGCGVWVCFRGLV